MAAKRRFFVTSPNHRDPIVVEADRLEVGPSGALVFLIDGFAVDAYPIGHWDQCSLDPVAGSRPTAVRGKP
jgi:hypothetical protein